MMGPEFAGFLPKSYETQQTKATKYSNYICKINGFRVIQTKLIKVNATPGLADVAALAAQLRSIRQAGFLVVDSLVFVGITDVCTPILSRNRTAQASIVVPGLCRIGADSGTEWVLREQMAACRQISEELL